MLQFIIKRMVIRNQEAWDDLKDYFRSFDIHKCPGKNVPKVEGCGECSPS